MADSVVKALMLDKVPLDGKAILIVQHNYGSPFLHSLLSSSAKQNRKICLVSFNQSVSYYHSVGTRLGWNLKAQQSKQHLTFIGGLQALREVLLTKPPDGPNIFDFVLHPTSSVNPLQVLSDQIKSAVSNWTNEPFTIVIDELDALLSLGVTVKDLVAFYQLCHSLIRSPGPSSQGSLVVSLGLAPNLADNEGSKCAALLSHWSDLVLTEKGLQTGSSKDLSGTLSIRWNVPPFSPEQVYQFKSFERGIRLFAPGTCSAVL